MNTSEQINDRSDHGKRNESEYSADIQQKVDKPCLKRWWRQISFMPFLHKNWSEERLMSVLTKKVAAAETGHRGEVVFIIESRLPINLSYRQGSKQRAVDLFSQYRVWDTEENTGVLVYLNICEHRLQIIADRGINAKVGEEVWQEICDKAIMGLKQAKIQSSLEQLLDDIGGLLRTHYFEVDDIHGNELCNKVIRI